MLRLLSYIILDYFYKYLQTLPTFRAYSTGTFILHLPIQFSIKLTMSTNLNFRIATLDDAPQVQQLIISAFRAHDTRQDWTGDMSLASNFSIPLEVISDQISTPESAIILATDNTGNIAATVTVTKRSDGVGRISWLAVDPNQHRGGVGGQILTHGEEYCRRVWGLENLGLNALVTRKELIAWYIRRGYVKTGETSPFPYEHFKERDLPEGLCFVEMEKGTGIQEVV